MTLDEILTGLLPSGHDVKTSTDGIITGTGKRKDGSDIAVIGVANGVELGTAGVLPLAAEVLRVVEQGGKTPILVLVDTQGQLMARRDEMRGLNEYLAHLAKCLLLASQQGHRTIGLEYGKAAAGAALLKAITISVTGRLLRYDGSQLMLEDE
jgi:malonate decarboxylase gamma subunit